MFLTGHYLYAAELYYSSFITPELWVHVLPCKSRQSWHIMMRIELATSTLGALVIQFEMPVFSVK
jgi:hypothetical protein